MHQCWYYASSVFVAAFSMCTFYSKRCSTLGQTISLRTFSHHESLRRAIVACMSDSERSESVRFQLLERKQFHASQLRQVTPFTHRRSTKTHGTPGLSMVTLICANVEPGRVARLTPRGRARRSIRPLAASQSQRPRPQSRHHEGQPRAALPSCRSFRDTRQRSVARDCHCLSNGNTQLFLFRR